MSSHKTILIGVGLAGFFFLTACTASPPGSVVSGRPACVDLDSYSGVILQVMGIEPEWESVIPIEQGSQTQWVIDDDRGVHTLSVVMAEQGCVCATNATSQFRGGYSQGEQAGLLQGAAVAPISELEYMSRWLESKILLRCPLAFFLRSTFASDTEMEDGTIWEFSCTSSGQLSEAELTTTLTVLTPECMDAID
jgi:hypothetical protein